ncbi:MAG: hypothetical protein V2J62_05355 [candidate division KSB1 bacterium]|nr:hypothetical protein [candidate division KSB1 bacterium]
MCIKKVVTTIVFCLAFASQSISQDLVTETMDQAKAFYIQGNMKEAVQGLEKALQLINDRLEEKLTSSLPEPLNGWRADDAFATTSNMGHISGIKVKKRYYKKGGGPSVDIEIVTNSIKIGNIKRMFSSPSMLKRAGDNIKIATVADRKCVERFDPIDRYAELIFVPTSTLLITITGQDMKNTDTVSKYADRLNWNELEIHFP